MQVHLFNIYSDLLWPRRCVMKLVNLEMDSTVFKSGVFLTKFWTQITITPFFIWSAWLCVKVLEKIIARTRCFIYQDIFRPIYNFNNDVYFLDFRVQKFPVICFNLNPF